MTRSRTHRQPTRPDPGSSDGRDIDALYGLEPVFEPGAVGAHAGGAQFAVTACPYCGESFETLLDLSAGSASYIEDCQVCCQPIQFNLKVDHEGALVALEVRRADE